MEELKIGIVGLGNVGSGTMAILAETQSRSRKSSVSA